MKNINEQHMIKLVMRLTVSEEQLGSRHGFD